MGGENKLIRVVQFTAKPWLNQKLIPDADKVWWVNQYRLLFRRSDLCAIEAQAINYKKERFIFFVKIAILGGCMKSKLPEQIYLAFSGSIFLLVAIFHFARLMFKWPIIVGSAEIPMVLSYVGFPASSLYTIWAFWLFRRTSRQ